MTPKDKIQWIGIVIIVTVFIWYSWNKLNWLRFGIIFFGILSIVNGVAIDYLKKGKFNINTG